MANRTIEAILRLSSKLGSMDAFRRLSGNLDAVDRRAKAFNRSQALIGRGAREMHATLMRYAAPAALVAGGVMSAKAFADIERRMERIGITADASAEQTTAALDRVRQIANDLEVPVDNVIEGLESLVASGKSLDEALAFLPSVAGTAHAADAAFGDMATTADAIGSSLKIATGGMQNAFDIIAKGGKAGKFELKDMASELPSLAPAFAALGYEGEAGLKRLVASLQTVRLETGSSSEAATSFMDVLTKMQSETITNNFKKFGVDLRKEMASARKEGEDTLEAFIRLSNKAVKGDLSKLPQLFTDKQMLIGMRALMNNTQEFTGFMNELGNAAGTVRKDLIRLSDDAQGSFDKLGNAWTKLKQSVGKGLVKAGAADAMSDVADSFDYATAVNSGLEKKGVNGFVDRSIWGIRNDRSAKDSMAWVGGLRTADQRRAIDEYGAYAESRAAGASGPLVTPALPRGPGGLPSVGPVPLSRPSAANFDQEIARQAAARPYSPGRAAHFAAGATPRDAERDSMKALRSDPNGVADAIDAALSEGSERAASKIADSGGQMADTATQKLKSEAATVGNAIGEAAASAFNRNVRAPRAFPGNTGQSITSPDDL
jgi:TP901 family phage tail tape measure protein